MSDAVWFLKRCPLFERLSPSECRRLETRSRIRSYRKGEVVYFPNDPGEHVLLLTRGRVKIVSLLPDGRESILALIEPGELFGELALFDASPRNDQAETVNDCKVVAIPRRDILDVVDRRPEFALSILKFVGFRLRRIENRLKGLLFRTSRERTVSLLLDLAERYGRVVGTRREIAIPLTHQDLANLLGTTRETVTLTLGQLRRDGLIELNRKRIAITNLPRLTAESQGLPIEPPTPRLKTAT